VIYEDRNNSSGITLSGASDLEAITGVVYMPSGALTYSGGSSTSGAMAALVVKTITFSGSAYINNGAMALAGAGGTSSIAMIE
jgi:hypothetical protein